jgi:DNA-binding transcriptional LysR family regulator
MASPGQVREDAAMDEPQANPLQGSELAAFVAAIEAGSVHGAADALGLTQSAVTKRLQALERRLGEELLERGRLGVRPTAAGRVLYPQARHALMALRDAEAAVVAHRGEHGETLVLAASHTIGEFLLPDWLIAFGAGTPNVHVEVDIVNSPGVLAALRERRAQLGFVEGRDALTGFTTRTLRRDELAVVVAPGHRWARRRSLRARELTREPYLAREAGSGTRAVIDHALAGAGVTLRPALQVASTQSVKRGLRSGGFALLSRLAVDAERRAGTLRAIPLSDADLTRELHAIHLARTRPTGAAAAFWRWLADGSVSLR